MIKKLFFFCTILLSIMGSAQDLKEIRSMYPKAAENFEIANKLEGELAKVTSSTKPLLLAYKGAMLTLKSKFYKKKAEKKEFFKKGVSLIENAITSDPSNIEIRYIRMSVQENSPKFLGYHKNVEEDKQFVLKNYASISSAELKKLVKDFVKNSENFLESEKANF